MVVEEKASQDALSEHPTAYGATDRSRPGGFLMTKPPVLARLQAN